VRHQHLVPGYGPDPHRLLQQAVEEFASTARGAAVESKRELEDHIKKILKKMQAGNRTSIIAKLLEA